MSNAKISFKNLKHVIKNSSFNDLYRSKKLKIIYDLYLDRISKEWRSSADIILHDVFGYDKLKDDKGINYINKLQISNTEFIFRVTKNKFPYNFENTMAHYLIWTLNGKITPQLINTSLQIIQDENKGKLIKKHIYWTNPQSVKSILDVEHAHIVVKFNN